jgi:hypothetical protein
MPRACFISTRRLSRAEFAPFETAAENEPQGERCILLRFKTNTLALRRRHLPGAVRRWRAGTTILNRLALALAPERSDLLRLDQRCFEDATATQRERPAGSAGAAREVVSVARDISSVRRVATNWRSRATRDIDRDSPARSST